MSLSVVPFTQEDGERWDDFCRISTNATFLHSRRFLSYHGDRFEDLSVEIFDGKKLLGVLPAARAPGDASLVVSHPGITYGGVVHAGQLLGERMIDAFRAVAHHYGERRCTRLLYKAVPHAYAAVPAQDDLYALFRLGARRVRCDLSSAIDLAGRLPVSERRRRALKKALAAVTVSDDRGRIDRLWGVLESNLARKHDARPVHSLAEMQELMRRFPGEIAVRTAVADDTVVAGVILFLTKRVWHAQYIASDERGYQLSALDAVFDHVIGEASSAGARYFDFGTSNENAGTVLNTGLYQFKSEFGGGGLAHEFYELDLRGVGS
jgi:hypothetical protein